MAVRSLRTCCHSQVRMPGEAPAGTCRYRLLVRPRHLGQRKPYPFGACCAKMRPRSLRSWWPSLG
jgi:hypothetical protein